MDENITQAETVETAAEEVQTEPTGSAAEATPATPEEHAEASEAERDIDVGIDIENAYVSDGMPDRVFEQRAKANGMTTEQYLEHISQLEWNARVQKLMNDEGYSQAEAEREARYQVQDERLKAREELDRRTARYASEMREFKDLYPDVDTKNIPQSVFDEVAKGVDLSSAYAKYERKAAIAKAKAEKANAVNAKTSAPKITDDKKTEKYFTMDEIAKMSQTEIRDNYDAVIRSLGRK